MASKRRERLSLSSGEARARRGPRGDFGRERQRAEWAERALREYRGLLEQRLRADAHEMDDETIAEAAANAERELATIRIVSDQQELDEALAASVETPILCYVPAGERLVARGIGSAHPALVVIGAGQAEFELAGEPMKTKLYVGGTVSARISSSGRVIVEDDAQAELDGVSARVERRARVVALNCPTLYLCDDTYAEATQVGCLYLGDRASAKVAVVTGEVMTGEDCRLILGGREQPPNLWLRANEDGNLQLIPPDACGNRGS